MHYVYTYSNLYWSTIPFSVEKTEVWKLFSSYPKSHMWIEHQLFKATVHLERQKVKIAFHKVR